MNYTTNEELAALLTEWKAGNEIPKRLLAVLRQMVRGFRGRFSSRAWANYYPENDHVQDVLVALFVHLDRLDLEGNLFGCLTMTVKNFLHDRCRTAKRWAISMATVNDHTHYSQHKASSPKFVPYYRDR